MDALGSVKERLTLAALGADAGRPVSHDTLIHRLWDDNPPARPSVSLHSYIARIRRRLRAIGGGEPISRQAHAYTLDVRPDQVDCHRFQLLITRARSLSDSGDDQGALRVLREADGLWHGEPLTGLPGLWAEHIRSVLRERHLSAQLIRIGIELRGGHFAELVPDLAALLEEHPTDELLAGQLMTATYGCGRQADALRVYDTVRRRLLEDLGADPGKALTRLHELILDGAAVHRLLPRTEPTAAAPQSLPSYSELVGREAELAVIMHNAVPLPTAPPAARTVIALQTVSGMGGVGKSLVALHAAKRLSSFFPDGIAYLDLQAHSPGREPLAAETALTSLIRTFGVPATELPHDLEGLVTLWRSLLSNRRAVIVLDDATSPQQLRPLLPGASPSLFIVTSRRRLTGLPGIHSIQLDVLPPKDAITLFRSVAGEDRTLQSAEVAEIVRLTGYLPLAIELAAGRLASRPTWTTAHLLRRLTRGQGRLKEIRDGTRGEIGRTFDISYRALTNEERTVFRFFGLRFGPDADTYGIAALTDLPHDITEDAVEALLNVHLAQEPEPERYTLHDLLGEYSRALVMSEETESARTEAIGRVIRFYLHASDIADRMIYPRGLRPDRPSPASPHPLPPWDDPQSARRWLLAERTALIAAERHCRVAGRLGEAAALAGALAAFLDDEGYSADAQRMHASAVQHWHTTGERQSEAHASIDLGNALSHCGRYDEARAAYQEAHRTATDIGDTEAGAEALHQLGVLHWNTGRLAQALEFQQETLRLRSASGDVWQIARSRNNLGITHLYLGNFQEAQENFDLALAGFRKVTDMREYAHVLNNLSDLYLRMGRADSARNFLEEVLAVLSESGSPSERAVTQVNLANTMNSPEELDTMMDLYQESLATFRRLGARRNASDTLHAMGVALHAAGRFAEAAVRHEHALDMARSVGAAHEEAQALHSLGLTEHRLGQSGSAVAHITQAVEAADRIGAAREAAQARESLAELQGSPIIRLGAQRIAPE
ncbi:BTAD domain-containing putative transcriptional regulator [Streptomyces sp. NPDC101776]|uniref:AfsR/SARP family transcriptional regulator n=1 Tax=Streptomyces sp. NPDC101776 TaxID=3366146 RepID=UPI003815BC9A